MPFPLGAGGAPGAPLPATSAAALPAAISSASAPLTPFGIRSFFVVACGIVLPSIAVCVELATGICAEHFFDPLPAWRHVVLFLLVPLTNALLVLSSPAARARWRWPLGLLAGAAVTVITLYALAFLPLLPLSMFAITIGYGFCSLSPLLALPATLLACARLRAPPDAGFVAPRRAPLLGAVAVLLLMTAAELRGIVTHVGLVRAASPDAAESRAGIALLRRFGDHDVLLARGLGQPRPALDAASLLVRTSRPVPPRVVRQIHYRVTGVPPGDLPAPRRRTRSRWTGEVGWPWRGGAGGGRDVQLSASLLQGRLDPDAAQAYLEWTLMLRNDGDWDREGRLLLQLPPGGVVSRATLWVDGVPREAAFAGRAETTAAYEAIVQRRKDPLLVTTAGPDLVLAQAFPVPAGGGTLQFRLGITAPLLLPSPDEARLQLPHVADSNLTLAARHRIELQSPRALQSPGLTVSGSDGRVLAEGELDDAALRDPAHTVSAGRDASVTLAHCPLRDRPDDLVVARIEEGWVPRPRRVVVVVDGSLSAAPAWPAVARWLPSLPPDVDSTVLLASDDVERLGRVDVPPAESLALAAGRLVARRPAGGCDNVPALERALQLCEDRADALLVWLHGRQTIDLSPAEPLLLDRGRGQPGPHVLLLALVPGAHVVADAWQAAGSAERVPRSGALEEDLQRLTRRAQGVPDRLSVVRERQPRADAPAPGSQVSSDLARLWAHEESRRLLGDGETAAALQLAVTHQLVTPVSGAVVLESDAQHEAAGLAPAATASVPTVPEPALAALVAIALALLLLVGARRAAARAA